MGNIHIFIKDELHERLRRVCRHKVTQQKFLEEGIERLVSEKEKGATGASYCDRDKLSVSKVFLVDRERAERCGEPSDDVMMGIDTANIQIPRIGGWHEGDKKEEETACEGVAISPQYYVPDDKEDE
jgi:hypothetical protein